MCDDIFDDSDENDCIAEHSWNKVVGEINKAGYREGLEAGKEEVLQEGFNQTFSTSSRLLYKIAQLRGRISAKLSYGLMKTESLNKTRESNLEKLIQDVVELESDLLQFSKVEFTGSFSDSFCMDASPVWLSSQTDPEDSVKISTDESKAPEQTDTGVSKENADSGIVKTDRPSSCSQLHSTAILTKQICETNMKDEKCENNGIYSSPSDTDNKFDKMETERKGDSALLTVWYIQAKLTSLNELFHSIVS